MLPRNLPLVTASLCQPAPEAPLYPSCLPIPSFLSSEPPPPAFPFAVRPPAFAHLQPLTWSHPSCPHRHILALLSSPVASLHLHLLLRLGPLRPSPLLSLALSSSSPLFLPRVPNALTSPLSPVPRIFPSPSPRPLPRLSRFPFPILQSFHSCHLPAHLNVFPPACLHVSRRRKHQFRARDYPLLFELEASKPRWH